MKQTTTEIFIEVEEIIQIKRERREKPPEENANEIIEICPHCHQAILESTVIEIKGEKI